MNICLMGASLRSSNRGVAALGVSLISLCLRAMPRAKVTLLISGNKPDTFRFTLDGTEHTIKTVYCRLSPRSRVHDHLLWILALSIVFRLAPVLRTSILTANAWIRTVAEADLIGDIRGGDSFSDI